MALDLAKIRAKVAQLNGEKSNSGSFSDSGVKMWKPSVGQHVVRFLPCPGVPDGLAFYERWLYYGIGKGGRIVSPKNLGGEDPIDDFIHKLFQTKDETDRALAIKLLPKLSTLAIIIDRNDEAAGPQLWAMNKMVASEAMAMFLDAEVGDFTDPGPEGRDMKVNVTVSPKKFNGNTVHDVKMSASFKTTPLHADSAKTKEWLGNPPPIEKEYKVISSQEMKKRFEEFMSNGGPVAVATPKDNETSRGGDGKDEVADLAASINLKSESKTETKEKPKNTKKSDKDFNSIDDALDDVLGELDDLAS